MINPPVEPSAGDRVSATWLKALLRYVRATRPVAGPGIRSRVTPNGTHLSCSVVPGKRRAGGDLSCFRIAAVEYTESNGTIASVDVSLANLYYRIAGKTYELEVEEEEEEATISSNSPDFVIALRCEVTDGSETPSAELVVLPSIAQLQTQERNRNYYHDPIWLFRDFAPAVDLRTAPRMIMTEF